MKKSELKKIIREELENSLNDNSLPTEEQLLQTIFDHVFIRG